MNGFASPRSAASAQRVAILVGAVVAGADVLADRELVAHEVLEDDADPAVQRRAVPTREGRGRRA